MNHSIKSYTLVGGSVSGQKRSVCCEQDIIVIPVPTSPRLQAFDPTMMTEIFRVEYYRREAIRFYNEDPVVFYVHTDLSSRQAMEFLLNILRNNKEPQSMPVVQVANVERIGANNHGYAFYVGQYDNQWCGWASAKDSDGKSLMFLFPLNLDSHELGVASREEAIKRTSAYAQASDSGYGGISQWLVPEELRGDPKNYRCLQCDQLFCDGDTCAAGGW